MAKDLLGRELTTEETQLLEAWKAVEALLDLPLPPTALANAREASSALWLAVNALALTDERPRI